MAAFLNDLPQDKASTLTETDNIIKDTIGGFTPTYSTTGKSIKLIVSPISTAEKDSILANYLANTTSAVDLIFHQYNTGTIQVYYSKAPKLKIKGKIHWEVTCEFRS